MKIGIKLLVGLMIIYLLMASNAIIGISIMNSINKDVDKMMKSDYVSVLASERMIKALYDVNLQESYFLAIGDDKYLDAYNSSKEEFLIWYEKALSVKGTSKEFDLLENISNSFQKYDDYHENIVQLYNSGLVEMANNLSLGESNDEFYRTYDLCIDLETLNTVSMERSYDDVSDSMTYGIWSLSLFSLVSLIAAILFGSSVSRSLTRNFKILTNGAKKIGQGDLGHQIEVRGNDEFSILSRTFNLMSVNLKQRDNELKKKNVEIEKANNDLKKMDTMKSLLLGNVSHELRTPLASIKGHIELVLDEQVGGVNEKQKEMLTIANQDADHLDKLVDELLVVSVIEFGKLHLKKEKIPMEEVVKRSVLRLDRMIDKKEITVENKIIPNNLTIMADNDKIIQVITNLMKNAINFSNIKGKIYVRSLIDGNKVIISIEDKGIGINGSDLEKIFDKFYQVDPSLTRHIGGVGLGLYICKGIVEAHGGSIWAESRLGEGTKITFTIPMNEKE